MNILVIGGGPAGLSFAYLAKKGNPALSITVVERNPRGVAQGWGIVFPPYMLSFLDGFDERAVATQLDRFDLVTDRGTTQAPLKVCSLGRVALQEVLLEHCVRAGVEVRFETPAPSAEELARAPYDLIVGADGVNSAVRQANEGVLGTSISLGEHHYAWLGTSRLFDALTLIFREHETGLYIAHAYKYAPDRSTFIVECDAEAWRRSGVGEMAPDEACAFLAGVFGAELKGAGLLHGGGLGWRRFRTVRNERFFHDRTVLLGDALHTGHFSIGSGTSMAILSGLMLSMSLSMGAPLAETLEQFENMHRGEADAFQTRATRSMEWLQQATGHLGLSLDEFGRAFEHRYERG